MRFLLREFGHRASRKPLLVCRTGVPCNFLERCVAGDRGNFLFSASGFGETASRCLTQTVQHASVRETRSGNRIGHHVSVASVAEWFVIRRRQHNQVFARPRTKRRRQVRVERDGEPSAGLGLHDVDVVSHYVRPRHAGNISTALARVEV